jgi:hypothetical protein
MPLPCVTANDVVAQLADKVHGPFAFGLHGFATPVFWLAMLGVAISTYIYLFNPGLAEYHQDACIAGLEGPGSQVRLR